MKFIKLLFLSSVVFAFGCAHQIEITPKVDALRDNGDKLPKSVALVITDEQKQLQVTTPGGGGDKVTYTPYADLNTPLYVTLSEVFDKVYLVGSEAEKQSIQDKSVDYVMVPEIITNSSSNSAFTWPPTDFTTQLSCNFYDRDENLVTTINVTGDGKAEFKEFTSDFSLSARRSTEEAMKALRAEVRANEALK